MTKLSVALVAGLCLTVTGAFAGGTTAKCCKTGAQASAKSCPAGAQAAAQTCCQKHAAGDKQECCTKHAAGNRQACCESAAQVAAAPKACCKDKGASDAQAGSGTSACCKDKGNLSPSMQNLMGKVDELRRRRAQ